MKLKRYESLCMTVGIPAALLILALTLVFALTRPCYAADTILIDRADQTVPYDLTPVQQGAALGATALQPEDVATVATTGVYNDLTGKPTIPSAPTFASIVALELAAAPRKVWFVYGDSSDGGTTPDATTQASRDALIAAGVPAANIKWLYVAGAGGNTFAVADMAVGTTIENVTLTQTGGFTFAVSDLTAASTIENVALSQQGALVFTVADLTAAVAIDNVTMAEAGGGFSENFDSGLGQFTSISGTPTNDSGRLLLDANGDTARAAVALSRGFYIEFDLDLGVPATDPGAQCQVAVSNLNTLTGGNKYLIGFSSYDFESDKGIDVTLTRNDTFITSSPLTYVGVEQRIRVEFTAGGHIIVKQNGTTKADWTDSTYSSFAYLFFRGQQSYSSWIDDVLVGAL